MEDAEYYFEEALNKEPTNEKLLSIYSEFLINSDQTEKAQELLELALKIYPNTNYYKMFLSLAQIYVISLYSFDNYLNIANHI